MFPHVLGWKRAAATRVLILEPGLCLVPTSISPQEVTGVMVTLTATATEKVQDFIKEHGVETEAGLRVAVLPGGCSGFQYGLNIEDEPESDDEVLDIRGVKLFIDPFSAQYLEDVEIDYVTSVMGQGFTFSNPGASGGCGCGSSFTV